VPRAEVGARDDCEFLYFGTVNVASGLQEPKL
jgi:hypothetical protein